MIFRCVSCAAEHDIDVDDVEYSFAWACQCSWSGHDNRLYAQTWTRTREGWKCDGLHAPTALRHQYVPCPICVALDRHPVRVKACSPSCSHTGDISAGRCSGFRPCCIAFYATIWLAIGDRARSWWRSVWRRRERYADFCAGIGFIGRHVAASNAK